MSMRNFGCTGHVIKLNELKPIIKVAQWGAIEEAMKECDTESLTELVNNGLGNEYPRVESVFRLGSEDESEDLEIGEWYACFAMEDLFRQTPKAEMIAIVNAGIVPERRNWVVWG